MKLINLLEQVLISESVSIDDVNKAIDNHNRILINYHTKGEDNATGSRIIEVYAYGLTKAGNPVIRAFQPYGDTTSKVPSWKFFRLDRIDTWRPTKQVFSKPASFYYRNIGEFNPNGDETMSIVYKIADFKNKITDTSNEGPRRKEKNDSVFKTDSENRMERLRQQLMNPIKLSDLKSKVVDKIKPDKYDSGPKEKEKEEEVPEYKKEVNNMLSGIRKQLENPKKIDLDNLRKKIGDTDKPIKYSDLNNKLSQNIEKEEEVPEYKKEANDMLSGIRKQLENPKKIDLNKIPSR